MRTDKMDLFYKLFGPRLKTSELLEFFSRCNGLKINYIDGSNDIIEVEGIALQSVVVNFLTKHYKVLDVLTLGNPDISYFAECAPFNDTVGRHITLKLEKKSARGVTVTYAKFIFTMSVKRYRSKDILDLIQNVPHEVRYPSPQWTNIEPYGAHHYGYRGYRSVSGKYMVLVNGKWAANFKP